MLSADLSADRFAGDRAASLAPHKICVYDNNGGKNVYTLVANKTYAFRWKGEY